MVSNGSHEMKENLLILEGQQTDLEQHEPQLVLQLAEVRARLASVRARVADSKNVNRNAPICSLPTEIMAETFEAASFSVESKRHFIPCPGVTYLAGSEASRFTSRLSGQP
jgi:hypothetical protein